MWHVVLSLSFGTAGHLALMWRVADTCVSNSWQLLCNKMCRFSFQFQIFFFACRTDSGEKGKKKNHRRTKQNWTRSGGGAEALNENSPHESKCNLQPGCTGLVSPIIAEGSSSKDGAVLLYMWVAVSDKLELFSVHRRIVWVWPHCHYSARNNSEEDKRYWHPNTVHLACVCMRVCFCILYGNVCPHPPCSTNSLWQHKDLVKLQ